MHINICPDYFSVFDLITQKVQGNHPLILQKYTPNYNVIIIKETKSSKLKYIFSWATYIALQLSTIKKAFSQEYSIYNFPLG